MSANEQELAQPNEPGLIEKKIDVLWDMYKLLDEEAARFEKELLRCFIYAAIVIAIPFGFIKLLAENPSAEKIAGASRIVPFAIIMVFYYYLTMLYYIISNGAHKAGLEKKINDLTDDDHLLNYNLTFQDTIYSKTWRNWGGWLPVPNPGVILGLLVLVIIPFVTFDKHLLSIYDWSGIAFVVVYIITAIVAAYIFFALPKALENEWISNNSFNGGVELKRLLKKMNG